jgi:hypothetical protein
VDRIRASSIGDGSERYVGWLGEKACGHAGKRFLACAGANGSGQTAGLRETFLSATG